MDSGAKFKAHEGPWVKQELCVYPYGNNIDKAFTDTSLYNSNTMY